VAALAVALPQHPARISDQAAPAAGGGAGPIPNLRTIAAVAPEDGSAAAGTVLLAGDSMAWSLLPGVTIWNDHNPGTPLQVDTHIAFGCPAGGPGLTRVLEERGTFPECQTWHDEIGAAISRSSPDLVVLLIGLADLGGRPFDGEWRPPGDPVHDRWLAGRLDELAGEIEAAGVPAVWLTFPHVRVPDADDPTRQWTDIPVNEPARADRYNDLVRATVARHPGIQLVDLSSWVDTWPDGSFDPDDRDGVHFTFPGSQRVGEWLIPQLLQHLSS
jgi:lysophospholipase L1-like esterase